ncbi:MAG: flagellar biosynthetic protein FliR, partial [Lachnospiraceae bacterium]|nr:flagellar biosynthetic protein FliR [Lachnospiraceae bacterium]
MTIDTGITTQDIEAFLMVLIRITSFVSVAPFFNMSSTPQRVKIGLSVCVALLIYTAAPLEIPAYSSAMEYAFLVVKESVAGILIGFSAYICFSAIFFAGRMIDMEIGMSMANMFDMTTRTQVSVSGNLYNYLMLIMLVITDMHHFLLGALVDSFQVIPIGGVQLTGL